MLASKGPRWIKVMSVVFVSIQQWSSTQSLLPVNLEESSTGCLSAVPWCLERAHGLFNSQPIFCPSHHFILTLERSSGPHTVTFLTYLAAYTSTIAENIVSSSPPPIHFQYEQQIKFLETGCRNRASYLLPHTNPLSISLFPPLLGSMSVWWAWNHMYNKIRALGLAHDSSPGAYQLTQAVSRDCPAGSVACW